MSYALPVEPRTGSPTIILCLLRHGPADPVGSLPDEARQLTEEGRSVLRRAAPLLRRLDLRQDVVLCSPRQRAIDTATIVQESGLGGRLVVDERLAPGATWSDIERAIAEHAGARRIIVVGHEPDLSRAAQVLTGGSIRLREGGLCRIELDGPPAPGAGQLTLLLDPAAYG